MLRFIQKFVLSFVLIVAVCSVYGVLKYSVFYRPPAVDSGQELLDELGIEIPQTKLAVEQKTLNEPIRQDESQ